MKPIQKIKPTDLKLLVTHKSSVPLDITSRGLAMLLVKSSASYFTVLDGKRPVGLIRRDALVEMAQFEERKGPLMLWRRIQSKRSKGGLWAERIKGGMKDDSLIVEHGAEPDVVFDVVFNRSDECLEDDVILTNWDGSYFGNIGFNALMRLLHGFLGKHMRELRVQKETLSIQHGQVVKVRRDLELTNEKLQVSRDQALEGVRMKNIFLANMSHEIRTPMNGVFGMIDLLYDTPLDDDQEQFVSTARSSAQTLMRIIDDILDFSKIEAGKMSVELMPFNIIEIVESSASLFSEAATDKDILLAVNFDDVPAWVIGDPHRYQQILNNLVSNAIKFTQGGKVEIFLTVASCGEGAGVLTEVKDTGIGITPTAVTKLFEPFTQADDSHTREYGGTGLGLSICKNLCELLDGSIDCDSEVSKGTTFSFVLPLKAYDDGGRSANPISQKMVCNSEVKHTRKDYNGMRVLLVEDNLVNQEVARRVLNKLKCEVVIAENGQVGIEHLNNGRFDCVFMDCQMPVMDGYEATAQIRKGKAGVRSRDVFISAMTAHALSGDQQKCLEIGMDHYISKPFVLHDFCGALDMAIEKGGPAIAKFTLLDDPEVSFGA